MQKIKKGSAKKKSRLGTELISKGDNKLKQVGIRSVPMTRPEPLFSTENYVSQWQCFHYVFLAFGPSFLKWIVYKKYLYVVHFKRQRKTTGYVP